MGNTKAHDDELAEYRAAHVPLYNNQPLKLGLFAINLSNTLFCSTVPTSFEVSWPHSLAIAELVERLGLEVIVPAARWRGYGGQTDFNGRTFEALTYAAGLLARTTKTMVFSTIHASVMNPVVAAKAIATLDHISNGRAGLNIVMGWNSKEMEMLGIELLAHGNRYAYGAEWTEVVYRLWQEHGSSDFKGTYFDLKGLQAAPKPIQPKPVVLNAGMSPKGAEFSARYADFNFTGFGTEAQATQSVKATRDMAWERFRRKIGTMTACIVVCRDTEQEARAAYKAILDHADRVAAENYLAGQGVSLATLGERERVEAVNKFVPGLGGHALVGTPEQVVEGFMAIKRAGIDGVLISLVDYIQELKYFEDRVMPLMKQAGLRL